MDTTVVVTAFMTLAAIVITVLFTNYATNKTVSKVGAQGCKHTDEVVESIEGILKSSKDHYERTISAIEKDGKETRKTIESVHKSIKSELKPSPP